MKHKQLKYIVGYTVLSIKGHAMEELVQSFIKEGYPIWDIMKKSQTTYQITLYRRHLPYMERMIKYYGMEFEILKTSGGLHFFQYFIQKKALIVALSICTIFIFAIVNTAWKVEVNGVSAPLEEKIKIQLKNKGLYQGAWIRNLTPLETIQEELIHEVPELLYIGIEKKGVHYKIAAIEKKIEKEIEPKNNHQLIAKKAGIIQKLFVETGQSLVERNDFVKKGDLLVTNEIQTDALEDGEKADHKKVPVKGKVFANTWYDVTVKATKNPSHQKLTGEQTKSYRLQFKDYSFPIWGIGGPKYQQQITEENSKKLQLWNWHLPIEIIEETKYEYEGYTIENRPAKVTEKTIDAVQKALKTKIGQDVEILEYYVLHEREESGKVKMNIYFSVLENIAIVN